MTEQHEARELITRFLEALTQTNFTIEPLCTDAYAFLERNAVPDTSGNGTAVERGHQ